MKIARAAFLLTYLLSLQTAATARAIICGVPYQTMTDVGGAVASLVIVIAAIKWTGSENDAGARKSAKDAIVHAVVGLIILTVGETVIGGMGGGGC